MMENERRERMLSRRERISVRHPAPAPTGVMPGLDPGIHTKPQQSEFLRSCLWTALMDRRVKPGDDTFYVAAVCSRFSIRLRRDLQVAQALIQIAADQRIEHEGCVHQLVHEVRRPLHRPR